MLFEMLQKTQQMQLQGSAASQAAAEGSTELLDGTKGPSRPASTPQRLLHQDLAGIEQGIADATPTAADVAGPLSVGARSKSFDPSAIIAAHAEWQCSSAGSVPKLLGDVSIQQTASQQLPAAASSDWPLRLPPQIRRVLAIERKVGPKNREKPKVRRSVTFSMAHHARNKAAAENDMTMEPLHKLPADCLGERQGAAAQLAGTAGRKPVSRTLSCSSPELHLNSGDWLELLAEATEGRGSASSAAVIAEPKTTASSSQLYAASPLEGSEPGHSSPVISGIMRSSPDKLKLSRQLRQLALLPSPEDEVLVDVPTDSAPLSAPGILAVKAHAKIKRSVSFNLKVSRQGRCLLWVLPESCVCAGH